MTLTDKHKQILDAQICPYCGKEPEFVDSSTIYGKSYGMIYLCRGCDAYVGVHEGSKKALGRLADKQLRYWKKQAHEYFDKIWKLELRSRRGAYKWLSEKLDLHAEYTHIGMFSVKTCKEVVYYSKQLLNDMRRLDLDCGDEPKTEYFEL